MVAPQNGSNMSHFEELSEIFIKILRESENIYGNSIYVSSLPKNI
jgi:hypothetical protein